MVTATMIAACGIVTATPPMAVNAVPGSLQTIPALKQWSAHSGSFAFTSASRIVVDPAYAAQLSDDAATFASDLRDLTGRTVSVVQGSAAIGDIRLTLGGSGPAEGYTMTVGDSVTIQASQDIGAFYGTRTMLQLLRQSSTIPAGTAVDAPTKPERGLMIDNGRKYVSVPWLQRHIKELAYLKMNRFHLHLSDTFGFRLESSTHPEVVSAQHYTKQEIRDLVALAARYHVMIVPEIDMPGHMNAILANHPELQLDDTSGNRNPYYLDLSEPGAYTLARDLLTEFLPLFPAPYWHLGADEYVTNYASYPQLLTYARATYGPNATAKDSYYGFINWANDIVRAGGKTMRMWNDGIRSGDGTITPASNIHVEFWYNYGLTPQQLLGRGHIVSNQSWDPTYYVLGGGKPNLTWAYETWTPDLFQGNQAIDDAARNLGSNVHVWCDNPNAETEDQISAGIRRILRVVAQQTWGSPKPAATYSGFAAIIDTVGRSPGWQENTGNLALNRPVSASSTETADFPAVNAVDGTTGTRWSSAYTDPTWIQVDLGSSREISRVVLRWEAAYGRAYQIQTSTDGSSWTTAFTTTSGDGGVDEIVVAATGRYVRMYGTQRATAYGYSLWEFEVYGAALGMIRGIGSARCVDVTGGSSADGTAVVLWDCHGGPNQVWTAHNDGTLRSLGKCLQPSGGSTADGAAMIISSCNGASYQRWSYSTTSRSYQTGGKCLDAYGGQTVNGTRLILWTCHGGTNQQWTAPGS